MMLYFLQSKVGSFLREWLCCFGLIFILGGEASAEERAISVGISFSIPPWVITETNSGIELDILRESLAVSNIKLEPVYLPNSRIFIMFKDGLLDGMINTKLGMLDKGFYSEPVVVFENVAISRTSKGYMSDIDLEFLQDKQVVGFQKASTYLGYEFAKMAKQNSNYREYAKQQVQLNLLFVRDVDFIVMDKSIFKYYRRETIRQLKANGKENQIPLYSQPVTFHPLFDQNHYRFVFKEASVRDAFNHGLEKLRASGRYDEIIDHYTSGDL